MMSQVNIISVDLSEINLNQWSHITFSSNSDRGSFLQITNSQEILAFKESDHIPFSQSSYFWEACIGFCEPSKAGFKGGIREVLLFGEYITPEIANKIKN